MNPREPEDDESEFTLLSRGELESRIRERTAYHENLMDTMVDVLVQLDPSGRIEMANESLTTILGYERSEVIGKPIDALFASTEENEQLSEMLTSGEFVERLLGKGHVVDMEIYFATAEGEAIPMSVSASVIRDEEGVAGIVCVAKDISERKAAEDTAEFLHSLLRHDVGNKLQVTQGYLELLADDASGIEQEHIQAALTGAEEALELIEVVGTLLQVEGAVDQHPVSIAEVLEEVVRRHEDLRAQQDVRIDNRVHGRTRVMAGKLLKELFSNLLENALIHSGGNQIEISAQMGDTEVTVVFEDDGSGIPADVRDQLFEKGVTGAESDGSGLGMHLVERIAESYDGSVEVGEADLGGARFEITLPVHRDDSA